MVNVQRVQDAVRRLIEDVGELWRPAPSVLFLANRAAVLSRVDDPRAVQKCLIDVIVSGTALASRYGVTLQPAFGAAGLGAELSDLSVWHGSEGPPADLATRVADAARPVVECVEYYLDSTRMGGNRDIVPLWESVPPLLHAAFAGFASPEELHRLLGAHLSTMSRAVPSDFPAEFDPARAESVSLIKPIQNATYCPFALKSVLWGAPSYDQSSTLEENLRAAEPTIREFLRVLNLVGRDLLEVMETPQDRDVVDGYVFAFPTSVFGSSFDDLTRLFRRFMEFLVSTFTPADGVVSEVVTDKNWYLVMEGEEVFVSVFAPCYPSDHSRYTFGVTDQILIMLQPEAAVLRLLNRRNYHKRATDIRDRFRDGFQAYELADREINRFLLPMAAGDPAVRWYDLPLELRDAAA